MSTYAAHHTLFSPTTDGVPGPYCQECSAEIEDYVWPCKQAVEERAVIEGALLRLKELGVPDDVLEPIRDYQATLIPQKVDGEQ